MFSAYKYVPQLTRRVVLAAFCLALVWPPNSPAGDTEGYRRALIIGVAAYRDKDVPPLFGVSSDLDSAREIAVAMGIPSHHITELFNEKATKENITYELRKLARETESGSRILIYFSGHGTRWRNKSVGGCVEGLLTWDRKVIVNKEFSQVVHPLGVKAESVVIMFDACHSGGVSRATRSIGETKADVLTPKFFLRAGTVEQECSKPSNVRNRGLLDVQSSGIPSLTKNVVHIMSSRADEVSFDEPSRGGLATQAVKRCMLGEAKDLDGSGSISLGEIQECAQEFIRVKVAKFPDLLPHHVTLRGFRNLVPVAIPAVNQQQVQGASAPTRPSSEAIREEKERLAREQRERLENTKREERELAAQRLEQLRIEAERLSRERAEADRERLRLAEERAEPERQRIAVEQAKKIREEQARIDQLVAHVPTALLPGELDPIDATAFGPQASLDSLFGQRDQRRSVKLSLSRTTLRINRDPFLFTATSSHGGYLYAFLLGSDETSFYMLFPNGLDDDNQVTANVPLTLPRPHWSVNAAGPAGTDRLLVVLTETPRRLEALGGSGATKESPIILTPASIEGRRRLMDFMLGSGVTGSGRYWATRTTVEEVP